MSNASSNIILTSDVTADENVFAVSLCDSGLGSSAKPQTIEIAPSADDMSVELKATPNVTNCYYTEEKEEQDANCQGKTG